MVAQRLVFSAVKNVYFVDVVYFLIILVQRPRRLDSQTGYEILLYDIGKSMAVSISTKLGRPRLRKLHRYVRTCFPTD